MAGNMKKPKWQKPKLIILTRGKPEERLLGGCKYQDMGGPVTGDTWCINTIPGPSCESCNIVSSS